MLSSRVISSAVAVVATATLLTSSVDAHGYIVKPAAKFKPGVMNTNYNGLIDSSTMTGSFAGKKFNGDPAGNVATFTTAFKASTYKDIKSMMDPVVSGCGNTVTDGTPVDVSGMSTLEWANNEEKKGFVTSHTGPCEVWIDNTMVMHEDNCVGKFTGYPASIPVNYASCKGKCQLTFYWLALHEPKWQVYNQCVPIQNGGGGGGAAGGGAAGGGGAGGNAGGSGNNSNQTGGSGANNNSGGSTSNNGGNANTGGGGGGDNYDDNATGGTTGGGGNANANTGGNQNNGGGNSNTGGGGSGNNKNTNNGGGNSNAGGNQNNGGGNSGANNGGGNSGANNGGGNNNNNGGGNNNGNKNNGGGSNNANNGGNQNNNGGGNNNNAGGGGNKNSFDFSSIFNNGGGNKPQGNQGNQGNRGRWGGRRGLRTQ